MDRQGVRSSSFFGFSADPRVFLVDDDGRLRARVRELLEYESMTVVGEASSGPEALDLVPAVAVAEPLVVMMDVRMPGRLNRIETNRLLVQSCGAMVRVLVFTGFPDPGIERAARAAGAVAVLVKGDPADQLVAAVHGAWDGVRVAAR
jgi:two-component system response regulator DesR